MVKAGSAREPNQRIAAPAPRAERIGDPERWRSVERELLLVSSLVLIAIWLPPIIFSGDQVQHFPLPSWGLKLQKEGYYTYRVFEFVLGVIAATIVVRSLCLELGAARPEDFLTARPWKKMGRWIWARVAKNFWAAFRLLAPPTIGAILIFVSMGAALHSLDLGADRFWKKLLPDIFAGQLAQQVLVQFYFHRRAMQLFGRGWRSIAWVAAYFALIHLPNPALTIGTAFAMTLWAWVYQRAPNIVAIAISHCLLSAFLWHTLPLAWHPTLKVGYRFLEASGWWK
ncbi:MAG: CPBP family intramembrane metalloprotease [Verrucomicrobiae bacterium]|nr:CPBP family intramembrane metalloprotease [Verrucomicrobiae bacterium]